MRVCIGKPKPEITLLPDDSMLRRQYGSCGQLSELLSLPIAKPLLEELLALTRAQRRALMAAHRQLEADPLLAHLLDSRIQYRKEIEHQSKSGRRMEEFGRNSFFLGFRGESHE